MTRRRIIGSVLILILVIAISALLWRATSPREPMYKGKPLTYWLDQANMPGLWTEQAAVDAHEAINEAGTNAIPTLLRNLQEKDHPFQDAISRLFRRFVSGQWPDPPAYVRNREAVMGFEQLGSLAKDSVPAIIKIYNQNLSGSSRSACLDCLGYIGPDARAAIPAILTDLTNSTDIIEKNFPVFALGAIHAEPDRVVPALVGCLHASNWISGKLCFESEKALLEFGPQAKAAVPALLVLLDDMQQPNYIRQQAFKTIQAISPEAAAKIPPEILKGLE